MVEQLCKIDITCSVNYFDKRHLNRNKPIKSSRIVKSAGQKRTRENALSLITDKKARTTQVMEQEIILQRLRGSKSRAIYKIINEALRKELDE